MQFGGGEVGGLSGTAGHQFDLSGGPREAGEIARPEQVTLSTVSILMINTVIQAI